MSTAWYRKCVPQMVRSWKGQRRALQVEVWDTTCVLTNMDASFTMLINPANPQLSGVSKFPYFPIGGPQPKEGFAINKDTHPIMGYVSQWGGMETGDGMMFAANTVDGLVHQLGGKALEKACQEALLHHKHQRLKEGQAAFTPAVGNLLQETPYQHIIHAVPPFYKHEHNTSIDESTTTEQVLAQTYHNALNVAAKLGGDGSIYTSPSTGESEDSNESDHLNDNDRIRIAAPLLGAGCRGFPIDVAMEVAARALLGNGENDKDGVDNPSILSSSTVPMTLAFGIPSGEIRQLLIDTFDRQQQRLDLS